MAGEQTSQTPLSELTTTTSDQSRWKTLLQFRRANIHQKTQHTSHLKALQGIPTRGVHTTYGHVNMQTTPLQKKQRVPSQNSQVIRGQGHGLRVQSNVREQYTQVTPIVTAYLEHVPKDNGNTHFQACTSINSISQDNPKPPENLGQYKLSRSFTYRKLQFMISLKGCIFETYVKSKDSDLWHAIIYGDFPPTQNNPETKNDEIVQFDKQSHDLKKRLAKNNEAKMNFKKDATLKLFKSTNQERYEHVGPEVTSSQDGQGHKMAKKRLCLVDDLKILRFKLEILSRRFFQIEPTLSQVDPYRTGDDGVAASFQWSRIHKPRAHTQDFKEKVLVAPEMLKNDVEPITPKLLNKQTAHSAYIKHTQEEATVLRDLVEHIQSKYPLDQSLESACSASGSQPSGNTKKDKIRQTPSSTQMNKVEARPRKVKSSFKNKDCVVQPKGTAHVQHSKRNVNSELKCVKCNGCMLSDNHDLCVLDFINNVNARKESKSVNKSSKRKVWKPTGKVFSNIGYIWRPTGRTFTIVGNACPLTRITTTTEVPLRKPTALDNETSKPVVTLVYSRKPRKSKTNVPVSKSKVLKSVSANKKEPSKSWGSKVSDVPSSSLDECRSSKLFSGIWTPAAPSI
ncbi:hypothetical protein Tco_0750819 [Tanacetum coccineum]|uniref:Uncharacterized protein n=1 Tax=Tanacetum coccineum TaxID=301880 RepID=A0ABQ4Z603_9ASTR